MEHKYDLSVDVLSCIEPTSPSLQRQTSASEMVVLPFPFSPKIMVMFFDRSNSTLTGLVAPRKDLMLRVFIFIANAFIFYDELYLAKLFSSQFLLIFPLRVLTKNLYCL